MVPSEAIEVRPYDQSTDKAFLYSTWLRNYKYSSYFAKRIKPTVFFQGHHAIIDHLLKKPSIKVAIAHPKGDPDTILGYLVCETDAKPVVHFVFVKEAFRNMGVARAMLTARKIDPNTMHFTHWSFTVDDLIRKWPGMTFDPYCL